MKYLIAALVLSHTSLVLADLAPKTQQLQKCVADFALNHVEESNSPNESVISTLTPAKVSAYNAIKHLQNASIAAKAKNILAQADAVGLILQYEDEVQFIYVGASIKNGQCQIQIAGQLSIADITGTNTGLKPQDASLFFLNYTKSELQQMLESDTTVGDVVDGVEESLGY